MSLFLTLGAVAQVQIQSSTTLPTEGVPEFLYHMKSGSGNYVGSKTYYNSEQKGIFAFYKEAGEKEYKIYDYSAKKWLSYAKQASYGTGKGFVNVQDNKNDANSFYVNNYSGGTNYEISPYYTNGNRSNVYLNYYEGAGACKGRSLGYWTDNGSKDAGSRWVFELAGKPIESLNDLDNKKVYMLQTKRNNGLYVYDSQNPNQASCTTKSSVSVSIEQNPDAFKWAIYKSESTGAFYVYSIAAGKFFGTVTSDDNPALPLTTELTNAVQFASDSEVEGFPFMMTVDNGASVVNTTNDHQSGLINWMGGYGYKNDEGSAFAIIEVGSINSNVFNAIDQKVKAYELKSVLSSGYFKIKNRTYGTYLKCAIEDKVDSEKIVKGNTYLYHTSESNTASHIWKFIPSDGKYYISSQGKRVNSLGNDGRQSYAYHMTDAGDVFEVAKTGNYYYIQTANNSYTSIHAVDYGMGKADNGNYPNATTQGRYVSSWTSSVEASQWSLEPVTEIDFTIGAGAWSSMNFDFGVRVPDGIKVYVTEADSESENELTLTELNTETDGTTIVPANTAVFLQGQEAGQQISLTLIQPNEEVGAVTSKLQGTLLPASPTGNVYGIATPSGKPTALYKMTAGTTIGLNKAYHVSSSSQGVAKLNINFGGETTGVEDTIVNNQEEKVYYDLNGRRVFYPTTGIYVTGSGKKVYVK